MKITITLKRWRITISNIKKAAPATTKSGKAKKFDVQKMRAKNTEFNDAHILIMGGNCDAEKSNVSYFCQKT